LRRAFDLLAATLGLLLASPILLLSIIAIALESPGSPFYTQRRIGHHGEPFAMFKLRTMVPGAEYQGAGMAVNFGDPRITRVGRLLRRFSIDELPNLVNVLLGQMSLVGPRPTLQAQVDNYSQLQRRRLEVKPGITGWAQVNGRTELPWDKRIEFDIWYVDHRSAWIDLQILAKTVWLLISGKGLYKGDKGGWKPTT
jgi:lipopolysaccharide/colanic/teichoic acid biosynthesis glycosyltransferase